MSDTVVRSRLDCPECKKKFSTSSNLKRHVIKCNPQKLPEVLYYKQSANFKWSCEECGKNFNEERNLRNHKRIHIQNSQNTLTTSTKNVPCAVFKLHIRKLY